MSRIYNLFNRFDGKKLLLEYTRTGFLFKSIFQIFASGLSDKGLEIFRLSAQRQLYNYLKKNYFQFLIEYKIHDNLDHKTSNYVWVCWFQGIDNNTPTVVKRCIQSMYDNLKQEEIILLTDENFPNYVSLPDFIMKKYKDGIITKTHMTDILRLELLIKYGGIWIDSTVLCTGEIPGYIQDSDLFIYQNLKPGRDGDAVALSSWFIAAKTNNKVLMATQKLMYEYWKKNNTLIDYFLIHNFLRMSLERFPDEEDKLIKFPNSTPHILLLDMFKPFDRNKWDVIKSMTPIHKLAYKRTEEEMSRKGTYYDYIINQGII